MSLQESAMLFYSWYPAVMLAFEAGSVIDMRLRKIARGGEQGAAESRLMVMEKVDALFEAGSLLVGGGSAAELVEMYSKACCRKRNEVGTCTGAHRRKVSEVFRPANVCPSGDLEKRSFLSGAVVDFTSHRSRNGPPPSQRVSPCMVKLSSGRPSTFISR